ncbi:conserved hypothetical protein [Vibrio crassostreae]|uniref:hypothetical protein n=1 Tax=Vibrio splendidus TaxID=29497 RepID=UPI0024689147|nr:hypothetical protein [Vibrio splendidus]CAK2779923.1 conserved hypothetical protein [Vibrio crassostreae]MDH5918444.1 hypothetical protein [Vibrio splendidus]CAK2784323.1 conserved hypothetical protein [Vibrio crassostreae]CAK2785972.1 conserved hypothetical protein [Vibrio crassostreae]CAK2787117.1 conserved hypothetical protein [Vibrio crassostreae]
MFQVEMTINGKPMTEANIQNELEKAMLEAVVEGIKETVESAISKDEALQIKIDVVGNDIEDLSLKISGPDDIVVKIEAVLAE